MSTYARPYYPHELDVHPDVDRIRATITEEVERDTQKIVEVYDDHVRDAVSFLDTLTDKLVAFKEAGLPLVVSSDDGDRLIKILDDLESEPDFD